jgi:hypothetical protein
MIQVNKSLRINYIFILYSACHIRVLVLIIPPSCNVHHYMFVVTANGQQRCPLETLYQLQVLMTGNKEDYITFGLVFSWGLLF